MAQSVARVLVATVAILSIPFAANQFADGAWSLFDFILAGSLIVTAGLLFEVAIRHPGGRTFAVVMLIVGVIAGASVVVGEVDDAPGLILFGLVLLVGALVTSLRTARRSAATSESARSV